MAGLRFDAAIRAFGNLGSQDCKYAQQMSSAKTHGVDHDVDMVLWSEMVRANYIKLPIYCSYFVRYRLDMYRLTHRLTANVTTWVAITAVALNALWPLIYQVQPDMANMQMDICATGSMPHQDTAGGRWAPDKPSPLMPHCAFCTLVSGGFAALVAAGVTPAFPSIDTEHPRLNPSELRPLALFSYSPAHPRAPPASFS